MKNKSVLLGLFILVAVAQIYVPASMIMEREDVLKKGKLWKFKTRPIDPNDPMRGKYITLAYENNVYKIPGDSTFFSGQEVFVVLKEDENGYSTIDKVEIDRPPADAEYVKAEIWYVNYYEDTARISIRYPFDRFYMEEYKAPEAERLYNEFSRDSTTVTYAVVKIKDGEAVLEDVVVDGVSIAEIILKEE
ncbi:MAG: GDYXXLXY domain-containing protein [Cytophagales bacterium]|nr:GDYXXLXY domain-containing protein [Cytophagales bacterium]